MTKLENWTYYLKQLAEQAPSVAVVLPENEIGFPVGTYDVKTFLLYIVFCLEAKNPQCKKGVTDE